MKKYKTLTDVTTSSEPIFLRVDLNVPLQNGEILNLSRLEKIIPTLKMLLKKRSTIVIATHLGRPTPADDIDLIDKTFSTQILQKPLEDALGVRVTHVNKSIYYNEEIKKPGVYLLENIRFYKGETLNDKTFAKELLGPCTAYVNDAFSCAHRAHASTEAITKNTPSYAGLLMDDELVTLEKLLVTPKRPVIAIIGGSKVSTKIEVLENLLTKMDYIAVGGAMANTFLKAKAIDIGHSLFEESYIDFCKKLLNGVHAHKLILPTDFIVGKSLEDNLPIHKRIGDTIDGMILDFGNETLFTLKKHIEKCQSVLWNGPLGAYEYKPYDKGSVALAQIIIEQTHAGHIQSIAGGGDTVAILSQENLCHHMTYVSTAGGAFLEFLEGKKLPGVEALTVSS